MSAEKPKKTLFHSELVKAGPVTATIRSNVTPSKFKDKPPYVEMVIGGHARQYNVENDHCAMALDGLTNQVVILSATGTREDARIDVGTREGDSAPATAPEATPAQQSTAQPPKAPHKPASERRGPSQPPAAQQKAPSSLMTCVHRAEQIANVNKVAIIKAFDTAEELQAERGIVLERHEIIAVATNIAIRMGYDNFHTQMPTGHMDTTPRKK